MRVILFTNVRDEFHIREWVEHHLALGFDKIFIFDHRSLVPVKSKVADLSQVSVEYLDIDFANKMRLMLSAALYAKRNRFDWLMYLDGDEFLYLRDHTTVHQFLSTYPASVDQIGLNWLVFGSNYLDKRPTHMLPYYVRSCSKLHQEVKVFVRPEKVNTKFLPSPHCFKLLNGCISVGWDSGVLAGPLYNDRSDMNPQIATAYIAHYIVQSYETYLQRKAFRDRDDIPGAKWPVITKSTFHSRYNDVENRDLSNRYGSRYMDEEKHNLLENNNTDICCKDNEQEDNGGDNGTSNAQMPNVKSKVKPTVVNPRINYHKIQAHYKSRQTFHK